MQLCILVRVSAYQAMHIVKCIFMHWSFCRAPKELAVDSEPRDLNAKEGDWHIKAGKAVHTDHDYEMLESYNQEYDEVRCAGVQNSGSYKFSQCPAYVPVATSQTKVVEGQWRDSFAVGMHKLK